MEFKDQFMWVLDVFSEDRLCMVMMLQRQKSHPQGLATVGQSGAAVVAVVPGRGRRRLQRTSRERKRNSSGEVIVEHLFLPWRALKRALKVSLHFTGNQ